MQRQFFKIKDIGTAALEDVDKLEQVGYISVLCTSCHRCRLLARVCVCVCV